MDFNSVQTFLVETCTKEKELQVYKGLKSAANDLDYNTAAKCIHKLCSKYFEVSKKDPLKKLITSTVVDSQAAIYQCQTVVKVIVTVLQKWDIIKEKFDDILLLTSILVLIMDILRNESIIILNCRGNCGMAFNLLTSIIYKSSVSIDILKQILLEYGAIKGISAEKKLPEPLESVTEIPLMSVLSMLSGALLTLDAINQPDVLIDVILVGILSIGEKSIEAPDLLFVSKTVLLWTQKTISIIHFDDNECLRQMIKGDSNVMKLLINYVWTYCEHYVEGVRYQCKDIFKNILKLQLAASKEDTRSNTFIVSSFQSALAMPWTRQGKFSLLICLVDASDLYKALFTSHLNELQEKDIHEIWFPTWILPLIEYSVKCNDFQKTAINQYILPGIFKKNPLALQYIVSLYKRDCEKISVQMTSLLTFVRIARSLGVIKSTLEGDPSLWNNLVPFEVLKQGLCHSSDDVRLDVFSLLCESYKTTEPIKEQELELIKFFIQDNLTNQSPAFRQNMASAFKKNDKAIEKLFESAMTMVSSPKPQDSGSAAYIFKILVSFQNTLGVAMKYALNNNFSNIPPLDDITLAILQILIHRLKDEVQIAKKDFINAAVIAPMYGVLSCIRSILSDTSQSQYMQNKEDWKALIKLLIESSIDVSSIVCPIVSNSSPEGYLPTDPNIGDDGDLLEYAKRILKEAVRDTNIDGVNVPTKLGKPTAVTAQMILLCSWRAHKEVSLLFGYIARAMPVTSLNDNNSEILTHKQLVMMGDYFREQLIYTKHRGAFEQSYVGFLLHDLPSLWLNNLIKDVLMNEVKNKLFCATRRSAGLPFMVMALLVTEIEVGGNHCFDKAMNQLLEISLKNSIEDENESELKVHSLNVLRALFRETKLGECVMPYVARGVEAALLGFQSKFWAVRNSATLLFSSLMSRMFGVNRCKEGIDRKNCLTARVFFSRFPSLFEIILNLLKSFCKQSNNSQIGFNPVIYPILLLLGRLNPSVTDGSDSNLRLAEFVPFVQMCTFSPIMKTRVLAAHALVPLIGTTQYVNIVQDLFSQLPQKFDEIKQNFIHGILLQLKHMLSDPKKLPENILLNLKSTICENLKFKIWLASKENACWYTRTVLCEVIIICITENLISYDEPFIRKLYESLLTECIQLEASPKIPSPGIEMFAVTSVKFVIILSLRIGDEQIERAVCSALKSNFYESRLAVLNFLKERIKPDSFDDVPSSIETLVIPLDILLSQKSSLILKILQSREIADILTSFLHKEAKHLSCVVESASILKYFPKAVETPWMNGKLFNYEAKFQYLLKQLQQNLREDMFCNLLQLSGVIVKNLNIDELQDDTKHCLKLWTEIVSIASDSDKSICVRDAAVSVLQENIDFMLNAKADMLPAILWTVNLTLLQDDESFIRDKAAKVVDELLAKTFQKTSSDFLLPYQPVVALDMAIGLFVKIFSSQPTTCFSMLVSWMLNFSEFDQSSDTELCEDSPFEKGEMNMYFEVVNFTRAVYKHLKKFIEENSNTLTNNPVIYISKSGFSSIQSYHLSEIFQFLVKSIEKLALNFEINLEKCIFMTRSLDTITIELYKHAKLLHCFKGLKQLSPNVCNVLPKLSRPSYSNALHKEIFELFDDVSGRIQ
ncbi:Thyroid adenoma-associated [Nymphon striatum]|nr:Thyroid adenoma-associated [Nymphon striatum]